MLGHADDCSDHVAKAIHAFVLKAHYIRCLAIRYEALGGKFLTAQPNNHDFAPEIRILSDILQGSDGDDRIGSADRHAASVCVRKNDDVINVRVTWKDLTLDTLQRYVHCTGDTLHRCRDC